MSHAGKEYDVMHDIVVRACIRDRIIADLKQAIHDLAKWQNGGAERAGYGPTLQDAEQYATMASDRCERDWRRL